MSTPAHHHLEEHEQVLHEEEVDDGSLLQEEEDHQQHQQEQYDEDGIPVGENEQHKDQHLSEEYNEQDMIGQVIQGEDGELYLLAADDDANNASHEGIMDMNSVQEVKIMVDNETTQMVYYNDEKEPEPGSSVSGRAMSFISKNVYHPPQNIKGRRNRVYGDCKCPECGQSFVNTARLERHLAVHQIFGNFSCPLCAKTYKYEYNLFYHWRKTCRDLDDVFSVSERKNLDVNTLRTAVDDLVRKREHYGNMSMGISSHQLYRNSHYDKLVLPVTVRRNSPCKACGVAIPMIHMQRHLDLHRGYENVDEPDAGSFFCDLCGLQFRQHFNLIKHWRTACPEIQANLPPELEEPDDQNLKLLVSDLLQSVVVANDFHEPPLPREMNLREKARQYDSTTDDLNFSTATEDVIHIGEEEFTTQSGADPMVFADDVIDDEGTSLGSSGLSAHNRTKWINNGPVQCHECKRAFANAGRLERHMAGYHSSTGSHHCPLCGNRFKYDYNLLYHYRKSCPYTKSFIEQDMRQQLDAQTLRKLVRSLASKDLRVDVRPEIATSLRPKEEYGDTYVRREMLGGKPEVRNIPQIPQNRPGMPEGKNCPLCGIVFYGLKVLERHVYTVHPEDHAYFDPEQGVMREIEEEEIVMESNHKHEDEINYEDDNLDGDGGPPQLEKEASDVEGPLQIVDEDGNLISQVRDFSEVQEMIDSGQLGFRQTDRFVCLQ